MDLSKIEAVIVDDDVFKGIDIRKALEFNGVRNIMTVRNQENCGNKYTMVRIRLI